MRQLGDQFAPRFFARGQDNVLVLPGDVEAYQRNLPLCNQNRMVRGFRVSHGLGRGFLEDERTRFEHETLTMSKTNRPTRKSSRA